MDTNQQNNQTTVQNAQPVSPPQGQHLQQPAPVQPVQAPSVTPHGKEAAPMPTVVPEVQSYVEPAAHERTPVLESQVEQAGVEVSDSEHDMKLTDEHKAVGIQPAKESVPVSVSSQDVVSSPMTLPQATDAAGGKANDSKTWLGKLVVFVLGQQQHKHTKAH